MKLLAKGLLLAGVVFMFVNPNNANAAMTFEQACAYQKSNPKEITVFNVKEKNADGVKEKANYLAFLGRWGNRHGYRENEFSRATERKSINLMIRYGFENSKEEPYALFEWTADMGSTTCNYKPAEFVIKFQDGYSKCIPATWKYESVSTRYSGWFDMYKGTIKLSNQDLRDIVDHGYVAGVYIRAIDGQYKSLFSDYRDGKVIAKLPQCFRQAAAVLEVK